MRIDKLLSNLGIGTRSEIKKMIKQKQIKINGELVKNGKDQLDPDAAQVTVNDQPVAIQLTKYLMLNKPQNVITATEDASQQTVLDLIAKKDRVKGLAPVGRLDKDTTGLLLLTNDGQLAHRLLAPHKHVDKTYQATIDGIVNNDTIVRFKAGIQLKDGTACKPATLKIISTVEKDHQSKVEITITEGKYHQIKRMFAACGMHVAALSRIAMGPLKLDSSLKPGQSRPLSENEIQSLLKLK
ncbi:MAG TPA: rRNA pseudouridine synthase [Candidatus Ligilactobacillus faecavium]|nr:rRNA pseudouridine synthase [Candidatus Ligilactobacillus faecavium]